MTPLDQWRDLAREENARMREVCFDPNAPVCVGKPSPAVAERRAQVWAMYQAGMPAKAIAKALGRPVGTIKHDLSVRRKDA